MQRRVAAVAVLVLALIAGLITANRSCAPEAQHAKGPPASGSPQTEIIDRVPVVPPRNEEAPTEPETASTKLAWKEVPPQFAFMSSPLIPVPGKNRMPYLNMVMILRDHSIRWGMDPEEYKRHRLMIDGVRRVDEEILKAWGGEIRKGGPHASTEIADRAGLAAYLIAVSEGKRSDVSAAVERGVEAKYAFDDASSAARRRALAMLGSFPEDPAVLEHQRRLLEAAEAPDLRGLAAANLVRLGHEADALGIFRGGADTAPLKVFLGALSLGTWEGASAPDPLHTAGDYPIQGPESRDPAFLARLVDVLNARGDRESFLMCAKVLGLTPTEPIVQNALTSLWVEARGDPDLAVKLMENKYQWKESPGVAQILNEMAVGENPRVALLAASQLYVLTDDVSIGTLVRLLQHEDPKRVRVAAMAIRGGGAARPDLAIPALEAVIAANRDAEVVEVAKQSLKAIKRHLRDLKK